MLILRYIGLLGFAGFAALSVFAAFFAKLYDGAPYFNHMMYTALVGFVLVALVALVGIIQTCMHSALLGFVVMILLGIIGVPIGLFALLVYLNGSFLIHITWLAVFIPLIVAGGLAALISLVIFCVTGDKSSDKMLATRSAIPGTTASSIQATEKMPLLLPQQQQAVDVYVPEHPTLAPISGAVLRMFVTLLDSSLGALVAAQVWKTIGIDHFRALRPTEPPTLYPLLPAGARPAVAASADAGPADDDSSSEDILALLRDASVLEQTTRSDAWTSVLDFARAYRSRAVKPTAVVVSLLRNIKLCEHAAAAPMRGFSTVHDEEVQKQARDSEQRIDRGQARSILEGVPLGVKEEMDVAGYASTLGTSFLRTVAEKDSTVVARLRALGAIIVGKTIMHEIGIGVTGHNTHTGPSRNPYDQTRHTGGSSGGSAAVVASGLVPLAVGVDGGGSIRIPAALCGIVGLKATYGRVSSAGASSAVHGLDWSVGHVGPMGASVTDVAIMYAAMCGVDVKDEHTSAQPPPTLQRFRATLAQPISLRRADKIKIGMYKPYFEDAAPEIVETCNKALNVLQTRGALISSVTLPDLKAVRIAHTVTIGSEMATCMEPHLEEHLGLDTRSNLLLASKCITATDYVKAQRVRTGTIAAVEQLFTTVDVIATPSTGITAPQIDDAQLPEGCSDISTLMNISRFAPLSNFTGHPAISVPVGYDAQGLPIGLQLMGKAWDEDTLLALALVVESYTKRVKPKSYHCPI
eukprot:TRINITY_DN2579_c0_g1_i7.p1 TRINITY_DN2579_c0_g1~~TRINITY_DN2579_c0_g1_i7.p1  ORF type:complete len:750 (-),score=148.78 TRINITY_DN2579_c0_g1_i7:12-2261(-)